jgi:hypothetical protein
MDSSDSTRLYSSTSGSSRPEQEEHKEAMNYGYKDENFL